MNKYLNKFVSHNTLNLTCRCKRRQLYNQRQLYHRQRYTLLDHSLFQSHDAKMPINIDKREADVTHLVWMGVDIIYPIYVSKDMHSLTCL